MRRLLVLLAIAAAPAAADPACPRAVQVRMLPVGGVQMAVWIEDPQGQVAETLYVTRSTGALGLANRPGNARFRSDYRWPYGARVMVLPVWAHARGKTYRPVLMGGIHGFEDNDTIGYHPEASSPEPFYCSPNGAVHRVSGGVDSVSCASPFYGSKGRYAVAGVSYYPPRADLTSFGVSDADDVRLFAGDNDLVAVSGATPPGGVELAPPLTWMVPAELPDGAYRARVEASLEADFAPAWRACANDDPSCPNPTFLDEHQELRAYGEDVLGQPAITWSVPFQLDATARVATAEGYEGYGAWDGADGALRPPDGSILDDVDGSGRRRLVATTDGDGTWRVKVSTGCADALCVPTAGPTALALTPSDTSIQLQFDAPTGALRPAGYEVRYAVGAPLTVEGFSRGTPGDMAPPPAGPAERQTMTLAGFHAGSEVWVGVRAVAPCGATSAIAIAQTVTGAAQFATLKGCFVATAAYGSEMANEVDTLRRFRDRTLLATPIGRLAVAAYYALSPALANAIAKDQRLRALARAALAPLIELLRGGATSL